MLSVAKLKVHGLAPISFELHKGDCLIVRGASGSGKSLLLRAIADLDETAGEIILDDRSRDMMEAPSWRKLVRYLAAESGWWFERAEEHFNDLSASRQLAQDLDLADKLFASPVAHLSSGERQRMAFIRTLEDQPAVLLLDEPTSALDENSADLMEQKIRQLQKEGVILIIVTHSNAQAERLATHTLTIKDGIAEFAGA